MTRDLTDSPIFKPHRESIPGTSLVDRSPCTISCRCLLESPTSDWVTEVSGEIEAGRSGDEG